MKIGYFCKMKSLFKELQKMWFDTLTNPTTKKYSRKSLMIFISFNFCLVSGISNLFWNNTIEEYIFFGFLGMAGGQTALSVIDKVKNGSNQDKETLN